MFRIFASLIVASVFILVSSCKSTPSLDSETFGSGGTKKVTAQYSGHKLVRYDRKKCYEVDSKFNQLKFAFDMTELPMTERANCMKNAVRGIGFKTAKKLIEQEKLIFAPTNWADFSRLIKNWANNGFAEIEQNVLVTYAEDNIQIFRNKNRRQIKLKQGSKVHHVVHKNGVIQSKSENGQFVWKLMNKYGNPLKTSKASEFAFCESCVDLGRICVGDQVVNNKKKKVFITGFLENGDFIISNGRGAYPQYQRASVDSIAYSQGCLIDKNICVGDTVYERGGGSGPLKGYFRNGQVVYANTKKYGNPLTIVRSSDISK